jgi:hypothetical protein
MKTFVFTYLTNYGEYVEVISALSFDSALSFLSDNAKGWGYSYEELDLSKEGSVICCGGEG